MIFLHRLLMVEIIRFPVRSNATRTLKGNDSDSEDENATGAVNNDADNKENVDDDDEEAMDNAEDDDNDNDEDTDDNWDVGGSRESNIPEPSHQLLRRPCTQSVRALVTVIECEQNRHGARGAVDQLALGKTCVVSPHKSSMLDAVGDLLASVGSLSFITCNTYSRSSIECSSERSFERLYDRSIEWSRHKGAFKYTPQYVALFLTTLAFYTCMHENLVGEDSITSSKLITMVQVMHSNISASSSKIGVAH